MSDVWAEKHKEYAAKDWVNVPSLFAETAITYFPKSGSVLDLGAGQGQDSRYFAEQGYDVTCTDLEQSALDICREKLTLETKEKVALQQVDLSTSLPFGDASFDVVYAHLSLHYFTAETTRQLFGEIHRVLKPCGVFAFLVNSTSDPEYKTGTQIEADYYETDGKPKRFFSVDTAREFARDFMPQLLDNQGETYKDSVKGVHNLIRFVGTK